jgi:hypothetical protein
LGTRVVMTTGTPLSDGLLDGGEHQLVHIAQAQPLDDEAPRPTVDSGLHERAIGAAIHCHDLDGRHRVGLDRHVLSPSWGAVEDDSVGVHLAKKAVIARLEGFHAGSMGLSHLPRRVDLVVHNQHRAHAARGRIHSDSHRVEQVARPIEVRLRGVALSADEHNRLGGIDRQVEPPRRLL